MADTMAIPAAECDEKGSASPRHSTSSHLIQPSEDIVSPGVARIEAAAEHITTSNRACILISVLLVAWAYGLDSTLRGTFQPNALNALNAQAMTATVNVMRAVISVATQPTAAKISDVFGRIEVLLGAVFFYVLGTAIEASASNAATFVVGSFFYQIGYTVSILILEVIVADTTSLRSRLFFTYVPAVPFLCNTWIAGEVLEEILSVGSWRVGFWPWCIIYPLCAIPLASSLWWVQRKAEKAGTLEQYKTPVQEHGAWEVIKALFWQLDVIGIILLVCGLGCLLVPLTLGNSSDPIWNEAKMIVPLVVGVLCLSLWLKWERIAPHPMVPFYLLKDRAVWGAVSIAFWLMFAWACQGDFLFSVLRIAFNQSDKASNRILSLYSFCSTLTGIAVGMIVYRVRRLKPFILFGTCLFLVAFGLLIHYRGGVGTDGGLIGAQVLLGIAGGFFPYAAQASIQAATRHEHVAVVTGLYLSTYNVGNAFGNTISGIIMGQVMPKQLRARMSEEAASRWFTRPLELVESFLPGTAERDSAVEAYKYFQRVVCIVGACGCLPLIVFAFCIRNPRLTDSQSLPYDELPQYEKDDENRRNG